ncbi:MAG: SprB repeat-containing protein [Bacteroidetes bacterium]|nr:SprB repeat-containing protein [Bacteroidota bacterium]
MKTTYSKLIMLVAFLIFFQMEGFSQTLTLTPSNFNGYNISCFGSATGSVNLTISGGTPPYTFEWSNAATTEDLINVPAGYYRVSVDDADTLTDAGCRNNFVRATNDFAGTGSIQIPQQFQH